MYTATYPMRVALGSSIFTEAHWSRVVAAWVAAMERMLPSMRLRAAKSPRKVVESFASSAVSFVRSPSGGAGAGGAAGGFGSACGGGEGRGGEGDGDVGGGGEGFGELGGDGMGEAGGVGGKPTTTDDSVGGVTTSTVTPRSEDSSASVLDANVDWAADAADALVAMIFTLSRTLAALTSTMMSSTAIPNMVASFCLKAATSKVATSPAAVIWISTAGLTSRPGVIGGYGGGGLG